MIVCVCKRVSDREIARHASSGMDFDDIQLALGVATQCGRCEGCARDVVALHRDAANAASMAISMAGHRVFPMAVATA